MNEQLQIALSTVLDKAMSGVEAGVGFLQSELPYVIHQLLMWKLLEASVAFVFCVLVSVTLSVVFVKYSGVGKQVEGQRGYKWTLTHDGDGEFSPHSMFTYGAWMFMLAMSIIGAYTNLFTTLQIWVAPKIYLIEYAASLTK